MTRILNTRIVNPKAALQAFLATNEATDLAKLAATRAGEATTLAAKVAGKAARADAVVPTVLAILRAELGQQPLNPRGAWLGLASYSPKDLVSWRTPAGTAELFVALYEVPPGVEPDRTDYWAILEAVPISDPAPETEPTPGEPAPVDPPPDAPPPSEPVSLTLALSLEGALGLEPGGSAVVQLEVTLVGAAADTPLLFKVASDEPGLSGTVARVAEAPADDLNPSDEENPEEIPNRAVYTLTVAAAGATPQGRYAVTVTAQAADWVDDPASLRYRLRGQVGLEVLAAQAVAVPAVEPNPTAVWGMSGKAGYTLAEFLKDSSPKALHLIRLGNVRPNIDGDGLISEGTPGGVLHSPPLTGHSLDGINELGVVIRNPAGLTDGAVVAALAGTARRDDWVCVLKTSTGFKLRTSVQGATGVVTRDSAFVPLNARFAISIDPVTATVSLHSTLDLKSVSLPRPAWPAQGVAASFLGILRADGSVINSSAGHVLAATPHKEILGDVRRDHNAQALASLYTAVDYKPKPEFPTGTRIIQLMRPGDATVDRTFYDPATHDLKLLGDASAGAKGGIVTTGAVGSGARTDWLPDVTWERGFMLIYVADGFFDAPPAVCQLALGSKNKSEAWFKLRPEISGDAHRAVAGAMYPPGAKFVVDVGRRLRHLFVLRYSASARTLTVREVFSGQATAPLPIPAAYAGPLGVSLGTAYRGKVGTTTADLGATEPSATRSGGLYLGVGPFSKAQEDDVIAALGVTASDLILPPPPTPTPDPTPTPTPDPTTGRLVGAQDFSATRLGDGDLRRVYNELAVPGWLYLPNSKRTDPVGVANGWERRFVPSAANEGTVWRWDSYGGVRYKRFIGGLRGAYFIGRGMARVSEMVVSQAFRATRDLRLLDVACLDLEALCDAARDESGIGTDQPDGFLGFAAGTDAKSRVFFGPDDPRNTAAVHAINGVTRPYEMNEGGGNEGLKKYTGTEVQLEEGIMVLWMVTALGAHRNIDKFSPTYEPVGNRPATPQYYRRIRDKGIKLYLDTCKKWDAFYAGDRRSELPMHVRRSLLHSWLGELGAKAAYAMILHGDAWEASAEGQEAARAWRMTFGNSEKVGVQKTLNLATWHEATHPRWGKCVFWVHDLRRTAPSGVKDATGEYISSKTTPNGVHPNNYTDHDYGVMQFLHEEGASFVTREWLEKICNTMLATLDLGINFVRISTTDSPTPIPYTQNGGNQVASLVSPWGATKSTLGATATLLTHSAAAGMAAYDAHGELEALVKRHQTKYGSSQQYGATSGLLFTAAKREGRLTP